MTLYTDLQSTASSLIAEFGARSVPMVLKHYPDDPADGITEEYDADQGSVSRGTPVEYTVDGTVTKATAGKISSFGNKLSTDLDLESMRYVLIAASVAVVPQAQDELYFDGHWWVIIGNSPLDPAETILFHGVGVRR